MNKACPFCGFPDPVVRMDPEQGNKWGFAECGSCGARGPEVRTGYDSAPDATWREEALTEWNCRAPQAPSWQPIEDAPRDGTFFIADGDGYEPVVLNWPENFAIGVWRKNAEGAWKGCFTHRNVTRWRAIDAPQAPALAQGEGKATDMQEG